MFLRNLTIIAILLSATAAFAQSELERLKTSYESAAAKAVQPLKVTYEKELRSLFKRYAQAGRLEDAGKVMAELKAIGVTDAEAPSKSATQTPPSHRVTIEGSRWQSEAGTVFAFEADGKGNRSFAGADQTPITWRQHSGRMVEATGQGGKTGKTVTWFFRFENQNEAYYGTNRDNISMPLKRQP